MINTKNLELTLYTNPHSRGNVVFWMLNECKAKFNCINLHYIIDTKNENFLKINPLGKLPALIYNDRVITESGAICTFLADLFSSMQLKPSIDSQFIGDYYRWIFFLSGTFDSAITAKITNLYPEGITAGISPFGPFKPLELFIEQGLQQASPYLCGDQFTTADVLMTSYLLYSIHITRVLVMTTLISHYLEPIMQRPAFITMQNYVSIEGKKYLSYLDSTQQFESEAKISSS